jgi:hypothetical protein
MKYALSKAPLLTAVSGTCRNGLRISQLPMSHPTMTFLLLFILILLQQQTRLVRASLSVALPLSARSPYLSSWLPQTNSSSQLGYNPDYFNSIGITDLSEVCLLL